MTAALRLHQLAFAREGRTLLNGVDLVLEAGATLALLGPSGGGKTTLLRLIIGLDTPTGGAIDVAGRRISEANRILVPAEQRGIAMVFQDLALWPHMTVREHLEFALTSQGCHRSARSLRISRTLAAVDLEAHVHRRPGTLSGGERQRVAIARALVMEPSIVLLDEPLANLDVALKQQLLGLFRSLLCDRGIATIYVTHDPHEAVALTDQFAVLERGQVVARGAFSQLSVPAATPFTEALRRALRGRSGESE